ncbi:hypothetical protein Aperf_G00000057062 [Anoplocephala perfoliata]
MNKQELKKSKSKKEDKEETKKIEASESEVDESSIEELEAADQEAMKEEKKDEKEMTGLEGKSTSEPIPSSSTSIEYFLPNRIIFHHGNPSNIRNVEEMFINKDRSLRYVYEGKAIVNPSYDDEVMNNLPFEKGCYECLPKGGGVRCKLCNSIFQDISKFHPHLLDHCEPKRLLCSICLAGYNSANTLIEHRRVHRGKLPLKCPHCRRRFSDYKYLMEHKNKPDIHPPDVFERLDQMFECKVCHFSGDKEEFIRHFELVHPFGVCKYLGAMQYYK